MIEKVRQFELYNARKYGLTTKHYKKWGKNSGTQKGTEAQFIDCRAIKIMNMVFEIHVDMWVYSKEDTMAHTRRPVVTS